MSPIFQDIAPALLNEKPNKEWQARHNIANQLRRMIENLLTCSTDCESLNAIAENISDYADVLSEEPRLFGRVAYAETQNDRWGRLENYAYELNPLSGKANPVAPPLTSWAAGDEVHGKVTLGWQYEGPPNSVHGGVVLALFDQFLGVAHRMSGQQGFTGTLTAKFLHPTPLNIELKLIGRLKSANGRKKILIGEMWADDVMTASCEALFIKVREEQYEALKRNRR